MSNLFSFISYKISEPPNEQGSLRMRECSKQYEMWIWILSRRDCSWKPSFSSFFWEQSIQFTADWIAMFLHWFSSKPKEKLALQTSSAARFQTKLTKMDFSRVAVPFPGKLQVTVYQFQNDKLQGGYFPKLLWQGFFTQFVRESERQGEILPSLPENWSPLPSPYLQHVLFLLCLDTAQSIEKTTMKPNIA